MKSGINEQKVIIDTTQGLAHIIPEQYRPCCNNKYWIHSSTSLINQLQLNISFYCPHFNKQSTYGFITFWYFQTITVWYLTITVWYFQTMH